MNLYVYCGNSPIGRTDPSGFEWLNKEDGLWGQRYNMSCTAASLVCIVWELYDRYGSLIEEEYGPNQWKLEELGTNDDPESYFREALDGAHETNTDWDKQGIFNLATIRNVLNAYLGKVDPKGKILPRYKIVSDWNWEDEDKREKFMGDILMRVRDIGPIMFAEDIGGQKHFDNNVTDGKEVDVEHVTEHVITLLDTCDNDPSRYRYWDTMWNFSSAAMYNKDTMEEHWGATTSYNFGVLVPYRLEEK